MKSYDDTEKNAEPQRRRRSFLANRQGTPPEAAIPLSSAEGDEEDIPVLTEIVEDDNIHEHDDGPRIPPISIPAIVFAEPIAAAHVQPEPAVPPLTMAAPAISAAISAIFEAEPESPMAADLLLPAAMAATKAQIEQLADEMTQAISRQMAYELPSLIEATLMSVADELRTGIMATMDAALRDFVANRKK